MRRYWFLILPLIVFLVSFADLGATLYFEHTHDNFIEANPVAKYIWDTGGNSVLISFKLIVTLSSCICMGLVIKNKNRSWIIAVSIFGLLCCFLLVGWWIFWIFYATLW